MSVPPPPKTLLDIDGPAGSLEALLEHPGADRRHFAVVCHPHPLHGGTMHNKVVHTLARALQEQGMPTLRFNYRGVGASAGVWDEGRGEVEDALAVIAAGRAEAPGLPLMLAGFSFGGYVAVAAAARLAEPPQRLALVAPSTQRQQVPPIAEPLRADTVVIHGEDDEVVPLAATLDWVRPQGLPVTVVPAGGHFFHGRLALLKTLLLRGLRAA